MTEEKVKSEKKESFDEKLSKFEKFMNIVRGKVDIKYRLRLLLEPDNLKTTTRLTNSQVEYVSISHFVAKHFKEFKPLADSADQFCLVNISLNGLGREEAIRYEGAIGEAKLFKQLGFFKSEETKTPIKGKA